MARLEFFVVAESAAVDRFTNRLSIFDILETITVDQEFPVVMPRAVAVTLWDTVSDERETDLQALLRIRYPDGTQEEHAANFTVRHDRHRVLQRIDGITLKTEGELRFEVLLNATYIAGHVVSVVRNEASPQPPAQPLTDTP